MTEPAPGRRPGRLKVGLHLPEAERVVSWDEHLAICRTAEAVGFDSLWMPDHLLYRDEAGNTTAPWECWSILSAVAAVTERVEIGPLVLCTSFRNPALVAKMAETVEEISGGRLVLGLGAGWNQPEYDAYGFPFEDRNARFREAFTIITTLLRDGEIDFDGRYYTLRECELRPRGPRPGGPPVMIGTRGELTLRYTLPHVQRWNAWGRWFDNDPARIAPLVEHLDRVSAEVGVDPASIERSAAMFFRFEDGITHDNPEAPHITGTPEVMADAINRLADEGIDHVQVMLDPISPSSVERFGRVLEQVLREAPR